MIGIRPCQDFNPVLNSGVLGEITTRSKHSNCELLISATAWLLPCNVAATAQRPLQTANPLSLFVLTCWTGSPVTPSVWWGESSLLVGSGRCPSSSNNKEQSGRDWWNFFHCCAYRRAKQAEQSVSNMTISCVFCGLPFLFPRTKWNQTRLHGVLTPRILVVAEPWNVKGSDLRVTICDDWHFATSRNAYVLYTYYWSLLLWVLTHYLHLQLIAFTRPGFPSGVYWEEPPICSSGPASHRHLSLCSNHKSQCFQPYPTGEW